MKYFVFIYLFCAPLLSYAADGFKFRAREHFETHTVELNGQDSKFKGFSNTINFWYEKEFDYAFGLAFGPVLGSASSQGTESVEFAHKIQLFTVGFEAKKYFFKALPSLFGRLGVSWNQLVTKGTINKSNGWGYYAGLGWEFQVGKVGLAPEVAMRMTQFQNDISVSSFTPSIGVHFYNFQ